jgi:hypothetical protein
MAEPTAAEKELFTAKRNYVSCVRWLKETVGYKAVMTGAEWQDDNKVLVDDAELAFEEAKKDVLFWRGKLNDAKKKLEKEKKNESARR